MYKTLLTGLGGLALLALLTSAASATAGSCPPCAAFDRLDKQIRDGRLPRDEAERQFAARIADLDAWLNHPGAPPGGGHWTFPLRGVTLAEAGAGAAKGYSAAGYDYFAGNRHGGHPSFDLFIRDRNRDSLDDRTGRPVTVLAMTGGIVVATEPAWEPGSLLRGGRYLWVYDPADRLLVYYAHNQELLVAVGDRVAPGTPIATVGRSGLNAWPARSPTHLHLTVLKIGSGRPTPLYIYPELAGAASRP